MTDACCLPANVLLFADQRPTTEKHPSSIGTPQRSTIVVIGSTGAVMERTSNSPSVHRSRSDTEFAALQCNTAVGSIGRTRLLFAVAWLLVVTAAVATAVEPLPTGGRHPLYHTALPPGAIWQSPAATTMQQGSFQPVAFSGPAGTKFSLPEPGGLTEGDAHLMAGLMVGAVYRFRVANIPGTPGAELYPTVELIGRTYAPPGLETSFPIPINLSDTDLQDALDGKLVTRIIYLEDPQTAVPLAMERSESRPLDIPNHQDALATADSLGRPIAIVRVGSMSPPSTPALEHQFYFGYPAWAPIYRMSDAAPTP